MREKTETNGFEHNQLLRQLVQIVVLFLSPSFLNSTTWAWAASSITNALLEIKFQISNMRKTP
jgi:hypothetical protein